MSKQNEKMNKLSKFLLEARVVAVVVAVELSVATFVALTLLEFVGTIDIVGETKKGYKKYTKSPQRGIHIFI